jgi:Tfp pilus assembly protein PilX
MLMKLNSGKRPRMLRMLENEKGVSLLAVVFVILVLTAIGYTFTAMMAAKQKSVPATIEGGKAFFIAEAGLEYGATYLKNLANWSTATSQTKNLGGGSFTVTFAAPVGNTIQATSTGTYGAGTRQLKATFTR